MQIDIKRMLTHEEIENLLLPIEQFAYICTNCKAHTSKLQKVCPNCGIRFKEEKKYE